MESALKWLPLGMIVATIIAAGSVGQFQLGAIAQTVDEAEEDIEENAEDIEEIQRSLIRRQGEIALDLDRLQDEQVDQGQKIDQVLNLLRAQN